MEDKRKDPKEKKCAVCGKDMYAGEEWAYKRRDGKGKPKWFCSYKCMRAYDKKNEPKQTRPAGLPADLEAAAPKEKVSRAVLAKALAKEIKAGHSVIAYLTAEGYKNPYEAYNAVRHYCETKMPELAEVLKPLRDLPKGPQKKTGRPRKYPATVEKVEEVPPVQCIQHVTPTDLEEAEEAVADLIIQGGVNYQLKVDEAMQAEAKEKKPGFRYEIKTIETSIGEFSYDRKAHLLIFRRKDEKNEFGYQYLSMSTAEWDKLLIIVPQLAELMGVTL